MVPTSLSSLSNPLITTSQLVTFKNATTDEDRSSNFHQSILTNSAAILLRLPHEVAAKALVLLQRYQVSATQSESQDVLPSTGLDADSVSAAVVYVTAKLSFTPLSPRSVVNVYAYLTSSTSSPLCFATHTRPETGRVSTPDARNYYVSEGRYEKEKLRLFAAEKHVLAALAFDTHVVLPHSLALTYIQALCGSSPPLAGRVFEHLNAGLMSPQLVYLTHQPNALAVAATYLAAKEVGIKLVEENWWEVFDVDREDLGFLVLAFGSLNNFAQAEKKKMDEADNGTTTSSV